MGTSDTSVNGNQFTAEKDAQHNATGRSIQNNGSNFYGNVYIQTAEHAAKKNEEFEVEILEELRVWLLGDNVDERYEASIRIRLQNTCHWIIQHETFEKWRSVSSSSSKLPKFLWINGPPGFGKTVLCARIIQHIAIQQETVAHYFFSSDLESYKNPVVAMQSWIYHIAKKHSSVANFVNETRSREPASQTDTIELFRKVIKMVSNCTLVVDGLDECAPDSSRLSVADFIGEVNEAVHGTNTRILVMSRPEHDIRQALMEVKNAEIFQHEICETDVRSDTIVLSKHIVAEKLSNKETAIQNDMARKMSDQSKGQFLWLRLQQDTLGNEMSQQQFQDAMKDIPADYSKLYAQNWRNISQENDRSRVISLLRLAVFSLRPLTVREISEAVLVSDELKDFPVHELPDQWDEKYLKEKILDLCCSFLKVQNPESPFKDWTILPVHSSVKEFYLRVILYQTLVSGKLDISDRIAVEHSFLAKLCITYMNYPYARQDSTGGTAPSLSSFANYAAKFWNKHAEAGTAEQKNILIEKLFDENSLSWTMWRNWYDSNIDGWANAKSDRGPAILLCYAIELGFVDLAMAIIKKGEKRLNYNSSSRTALGVACSKGYENLARELLAHGAKVGIRDAHSRTAVHYAAMNGHSKLVKLLIDNGANINIRDYNGVSPFLAASTNGHLSIMRQLIHKDANIDQLDNNGNCALFKATFNGHINAAKILIDKGIHRQLSGHRTTPPVFAALKSGSSHLARLLIEKETDLNAKSGMTILHVAISEGKTDIVKFLLIERNVARTLQDSDGRTPLFVACLYGRVEIVMLLIDGDVDFELQNADGQTPLFVACLHGHIQIVRLLIEKGAKITTPDVKGKTPLHVACANCHLEVARLLIEKKANINAPDNKEETPFLAAVVGGSFEIVKMLTNKVDEMRTEKADGVSDTICSRVILAASQNGYVAILQRLIEWIGKKIGDMNYKWTIGNDSVECKTMDAALLLASGIGHVGVVQLLLNYDANVKKSDPRRRSALHLACRNGHKEVAKLLIENPGNPENCADIEAMEDGGNTPLMEACANGHLELVKFLVQKCADIHTRNNDETNAAYVAACGGHLEVLQLLLSKGADIFQKSERLPIHAASENGHSEIVDLLIENGSAVMESNKNGNTPLALAVTNHRVGVVNVLLKHGVDVDTRNSSGETALLIASSKGDVKLANLLVDNCANISIKDNMGRTPLYCASGNGHLDVVKLLLDNGADMMPDDEGQTPLHASCRSGQNETTKLLLEMGADANSCDKEGFCPLYSASKNGNVTMVEYLIQKGADRFKQSNDGWSLITEASSKGHTDTVNVLIEKHNIDAEKPDNNGKTPLFAACEAGHTHTARSLLIREVNVNKATDTNNTTPLLVACIKGHTEVVKLLLQHDADASIMNKDGMTPTKAATEKGYTEISKLLGARYSESDEKGDSKGPQKSKKGHTRTAKRTYFARGYLYILLFTVGLIAYIFVIRTRSLAKGAKTDAMT